MVRREVVGRADDFAELGIGSWIGDDRTGQSEIGQLRASLGRDQHVARLDVAMDQPLPMGMLQAYGDLMVRTNGWDPTVLERFRADPMVATFPGAIDQVATTEQLEHIATLIPEAWLAPAATGSPARCVEAVRGQFDLGCDGVILHGAGPAQLEPIVEQYRRTRPSGVFDHLAANPGG